MDHLDTSRTCLEIVEVLTLKYVFSSVFFDTDQGLETVELCSTTEAVWL